MTTFTQKIANFFHLGRLPEKVKSKMTSEGGILYLAEGIAETAIFQDFKSPGMYCSHRSMIFIGFVAVSDQRFAVRAKSFHEIHINLKYDDPKFKKITFRTSKTKLRYLSLSFDAAGFIPNASGRIEIRLHLPDDASAIATILNQKDACIKTE